jgi:hypothetical protein
MPRAKRLPQGPVVATSNDAADSAHGLDCPGVDRGRSVTKGALG